MTVSCPAFIRPAVREEGGIYSRQRQGEFALTVVAAGRLGFEEG